MWRDWATLTEGCYLLRSNVTDWTDEDLWKAYIQLTEAEAAFRIHKSDLMLRPIWYQKEERVLAHILICFLAYVLWKTLSQRCQHAGLGQEPRRVFEELSKIELVDVVPPTRQDTEIRRRCVTQPMDHQAILLTYLKLNLPSPPLTDGVWRRLLGSSPCSARTYVDNWRTWANLLRPAAGGVGKKREVGVGLANTAF